MNVNELTVEERKELASLDHIHLSWRDYALLLLNSAQQPLRDIWHEKFMTSLHHWNVKDGSISESNVAGLEILSELPSEWTSKIVDDWYEEDGTFSWHKISRLSGSKRMKVHIGNYPQESLSNEANLCVKHLLRNWETECFDGKTGKQMLMESFTLKRVFKLAQMSGGQCISQDELLTYLLERPINDSNHAGFVYAATDIFLNGIPSEKFAKYWKSKQIEGFPVNGGTLNQENELNNSFLKEILDKTVWDPSDKNFSLQERDQNIDLVLEKYICGLSQEDQLRNMEMFCDVMLKEDVAYSPCYKKICICVLKNDVSFKYCGFGATLRERQAREAAISAFETNQEEKEKAKQNALALAEQLKKENRNVKG